MMKTAVAHIRSLLTTHHLPAVLIVAPIDLHYATGIAFSRGALFITQETSVLCIDPRYLVAASPLRSEFDIICSASPDAMKEDLGRLFNACGMPIGFDAATMTVEKFHELCAVALPGQLVPAPALFAHLRRPKRPDEIEAIQDACTLCEEGFLHILEHIHEGVTEAQLSQALKAFWFSHGAEACSFEPIIAFGANSACPHWPCSNTPLKCNSHLLVDIGVQYRSYHSDMTRVVFFGHPDPRMVACHELVKEAYHLAAAQAKPGVAPRDVDGAARKYLTEHGYGEAFVHGCGHGIGMQVHEPPRISPFASQEEPLAVGDVITIEPGVYLEGIGGIRLENTIVIEALGARSLCTLPLDPFCRGI